MRKFIPLIGMLVSVVIIVGYVWALTDPTGFTMASYTSTKIIVTISGVDTSKVDSLTIVNYTSTDSTSFVYLISADDSTLATKLVDATTVRDTITGLDPATTYAWRAEIDSSDTKAYSPADTASTKYVAYEPLVSTDKFMVGNDIAKATAWPALYYYPDAFTVSVAGIDTSLVYRHWPVTGTTIYASGDSVKVMVYLEAGYTDGSSKWYFTPVDSTNVSAAGTSAKNWTIPYGAENYFYRVAGYAGNGNATGIYIRQYRYKN